MTSNFSKVQRLFIFIWDYKVVLESYAWTCQNTAKILRSFSCVGNFEAFVKSRRKNFWKEGKYEWKFQNAQKFQNDQALELNMIMKEIVK